jgi:hypothetical protein
MLAQWLQAKLDEARNYFIQNASGPSPSAPGAYPGLRSGALVGSINVEASGLSGSISAGVGYAGFLASGTRRMAPRKMLREALDETLPQNPDSPFPMAQAVKFTYG